jgi:putative Mg2+ transporter-C (MgtC) family protein
MSWWSELGIIWEVALAMLLGGLIGIEREIARRPAGFRTHMLVAGAAALFVGLGTALIRGFDAAFTGDAIRYDPIRLIEAVVTGVSFLGAGTIFRRARGEHVEGLTTAASLLFSAGIGISVALREFAIAIAVTLLTLIVLRGLNWIETRVARQARKSAEEPTP